MPYKKYFKFCVVWVLIFFTALAFTKVLLENVSIFPQVKLLFALNFANLLLAFLCIILRKTKFVYWISGISFEGSMKAASSSRQNSSQLLWISFAKVFGVYFIYSFFASILRLPSMISILFLAVVLIAFAVKNIK